MKFLLKVLVLVTLIVISKLTKEEAISMNQPLQNPVNYPVYSQGPKPIEFVIPAPPKGQSTAGTFYF